MWALFPSIYEAFNEYATDFMSNILVVLDNYISRGTEQFLAEGTPYLEMVFNMYKKLLEDDSWSDIDSGEACKLVEVVFHHCRNNRRIDAMIPTIIDLAVKRLLTSKRKAFSVLLLEVIANSLYYNPEITLASLEQTTKTPFVFTTWFNMLFANFKRCHDKKVTILGLSSIYLLPTDRLSPVIKGGFPQIFSGLVQLINKLRSQRDEEEKENPEEEEEEMTMKMTSWVMKKTFKMTKKILSL
jgi:hypothetical protein